MSERNVVKRIKALERRQEVSESDIEGAVDDVRKVYNEMMKMRSTLNQVAQVAALAYATSTGRSVAKVIGAIATTTVRDMASGELLATISTGKTVTAITPPGTFDKLGKLTIFLPLIFTLVTMIVDEVTRREILKETKLRERELVELRIELVEDTKREIAARNARYRSTTP